MKIRPFLFLLLPVLLTATLSPAPSDAQKQKAFAEIDATIRKEMNAYDVHGAVAAVFDNNSILWQKAFGYDDAAHNKPAALNTPYRIGGLTMLWTATIVLQLAERGKVKLDDPVKKYLPEFKLRGGAEKGITVRHLLSNHSGLPIEWYRENDDRAPLFEYLKNEHPIAKPGTRYLRSMLDYEVIGHLIERVSGKSLDSLFENNLFLPLGMNDSRLAGKNCADPTAGKGFILRDKKVKRFENPSCRSRATAGGISTVYDLSRFMQALFNGGWTGSGRILNDASLKQLFSNQYPGNPDDLAFKSALGYYADYFPIAEKNIAAIGSMDGFVTVIAALPDRKTGFIALGNTDSFILGAPKTASRAVTLLGLLHGMKPSALPETRPMEKSDIERLRNCAGRYVGNGFAVDVTMAGDTPLVTMGNQEMTLAPVSKNRFRLVKQLFFWMKEYYIELREQPDGSVAAVLSVQLEEYGFPIMVFRRPPETNYPAGVAAFIGGYRPKSMPKGMAERIRFPEFQIRWDGKWLVAETNREKVIVTPAAADTLLADTMNIHFAKGSATIGGITYEKWF